MKLTSQLNSKLAWRRGFSVYDFVLYLVLALAAGAGVVFMYSGASLSQNTADAQNQITQLRSIVSSLYQGQSDYTGLTVSSLINQVPRSMVNGTSILNPFKGTVTVLPSSQAGSFYITMANIPSDACVSLATKDFGLGELGVVVGTAAVDPATSSAPSHLDPATARTSCAAQSKSVLSFLFN